MAKARYRFNIFLRPEPEGGGYTALVPALPGCVTYGRTLKEAREMAKDPIFLDEAAKVGAEITPASGEDLDALAQKIYAYPPEIIARATADYKAASGE